MCHSTGEIRPVHLFDATFFFLFSMTLNSLYENKPSKDKSPITEEETGTIAPMEASTTKMPWWAHINKRRKRPSPMPPKPHKSAQSEAVKYSQEVPDHIRCYSSYISSMTPLSQAVHTVWCEVLLSSEDSWRRFFQVFFWYCYLWLRSKPNP